VTVDERERAWTAVHDALAQMPGWAVGPCVYHGEASSWHVVAIDLRPRHVLNLVGEQPSCAC
jgi:hypothetical protein